MIGRPIRILVIAALGMLTELAVLRADRSESPAEAAREILEASGYRGGVIVHLGSGDGRLTAALAAGDGRVVEGLEADPTLVSAARRQLRSLGLAGKASVQQWAGAGLPYAENLINLLVAEDLGGIQRDEVLRVLVPGGVALVKSASGWSKVVKPWPEGMDEWSHWDHAADGNPVSQDTLVGPPRRIQWTDGPAWSKKHWGPRTSAMVTAGGRLFTVEDDTPTSLFNIDSHWTLTARDAFNGVVLWQRPLEAWTGEGWSRAVRRGETPLDPPGLILGVWGELTGANGVRDAMNVMVAAGDRLYLPLAEDAPVSALDAATGRVLGTYEGISRVEKVVCADGVLVIAGKARIEAVEAETGKRLWEAEGINFAAADGRVYLAAARGQRLECVDLKSGRPRWSLDFAAAVDTAKGALPAEKLGFNGPVVAGCGIVLATNSQGRTGRTIAVSAAEGRCLWLGPPSDAQFARGGGPFLIDGAVWTLDSDGGALHVLDPQTGEERKAVAAPGIRYAGHHARCYLARATSRFILAKERGADFVDLASGEVTWNNWIRGSCHRGVMPANGLLYSGQHSCRCYTEAALHGFFALAPAGDSGIGEPNPGARLQMGPAYGKVDPAPSVEKNLDDWPTFRHDSLRSGSTPVAIDEELAPMWSTAIGGKLTAPIVSGGRIYVASVDRHTLYALDAASGEERWAYTVGGRIDGPPTVHRGLLLFGSRDGWVYCLRSVDGELVWQFRAAPAERRVGSGGQLESAWPVPGSVLVKDGIAYCVAGRSTYLDGGLYLYALNPQTGELLHTKHLEGPWPGPEAGTTPETPNRGFTSEGALPDVLVADANSIYLRHLRLDPSLREIEDMQPNVYKAPALVGENRGGDHKYWDDHLESEKTDEKRHHATFINYQWFNRSFFQNFPGLRLYATTGLLDDSWHRRMYWSYGQVVGQYIVFRGPIGYAVQVYATSPREAGFNAGDGYVVYAGRTAEQEADTKLFALPPNESLWRIRVPFRPIAMILAGDRLVLAGPPDLADPAEALSALEGQRGGLLWILNASDGRRVYETRLDSPPGYEGVAATRGRLFLATVDGKVVCLAKP